MLDTNKTSYAEPSLASGVATSPISYADALENYRTNTDWWIVFDSFELPNAIGSALWIAGRTGLSVDTVTEALEGLVVLGLVKRTDKGFEAVKNVLHVTTADQNKKKRMEEHALISRQVLNHLGENARGALRFASLASNIEIVAEMYEKINKAILEADEQSKKLRRDQIDNIYLASFTAVTATQPQEEKGNTNA